jgi:hypothetical protein
LRGQFSRADEDTDVELVPPPVRSQSDLKKDFFNHQQPQYQYHNNMTQIYFSIWHALKIIPGFEAVFS